MRIEVKQPPMRNSIFNQLYSSQAKMNQPSKCYKVDEDRASVLSFVFILFNASER